MGEDPVVLPLVFAGVILAPLAAMIFAAITHRRRTRIYANGALHVAVGLVILISSILFSDGLGWILAGVIIGPLYAMLGVLIVRQRAN